MLISKFDAPKSPVKRGRRGSLIFRFKVAIPRNPARIKMKNAQRILFFSFSEIIK